jgi:hypothetical protein
VLSFSQDLWKHSRKVTSLFDWAGNSNLIGSVGLDNQMLLYDIRLSRPVMSKFINPPYPNCLKTFDDKLVLAPRDSKSVLQMFDMRKFDQGYANLLGKCFSIESCDYLLTKKTPCFDNNEAPFNFKFKEKENFISKLKGSNRKSNFMNLVVGD